MSSVKVRPLGNRIVVRRWPETELRESGLWLPASAREKPQLGDVLAVGPGLRRLHHRNLTGPHCSTVPPDISPGEVVVFEKMVSRDHEYTVDGERLLILPYLTILCAIHNISIAGSNS